MNEWEYLENEIFVLKLNEQAYHFIDIADIGDDEFKYMIYGSKVIYEPWMATDLVGELSEAEAKYPFAACYLIFKDEAFGNEDWNILCKDMKAVKDYLWTTFSIDYDGLKAEQTSRGSGCKKMPATFLVFFELS